MVHSIMTPITDYRFLLLSLVFWHTGAGVNITRTGTERGESSFECGTELVLTCQIDAYLLSMTWQNDSSSTPLAQCIASACFVDPSVAGLYKISANTSVGIFNLTIKTLTLENNGTNYICGHDLTNVPSLVIVKNYKPTLIESTPGKISVISGCIDESTEVQFTWQKVKNADAGKESTYEPSYITDSINITMCMGDTDCESTAFVKKSKSIRIEQGGDDDYRLRAILYYNRFRLESSLTNKNYTIQDSGILCSIKCDTVCRLLIVIGVFFAIAVIVGCVLLYVMWSSYPTKEDHSKEDKRGTLYIEILLHTVSAILWTVIFIPFFLAQFRYCSCDDSSCICCEIVLILGYVLVTLVGIHVILWCILLCVLYERKGEGDDEGDKHCETKFMVRFIVSTIPLVGLFPVSGWLIRIYGRENSDTEDTQLSSQETKRELPPTPFQNPTKPITEKTGKPISRSTKKEQKKIDMFGNQNVCSNEIGDQVSTSEITVKQKGIDTLGARSSPLNANATGKRKASMKTEAQTGNNHVTKTGSDDKLSSSNENPPGSLKSDDSLPTKKKSRKKKDENEPPINTNSVSAKPQNGNKHVSETGSDDKLGSSDNGSLPYSSKSDNTSPQRRRSKKENGEKEPLNNTKSVSATSQNGSEAITRTLSAIFHDEEDVTTNVSIDSETKM